MSGEMSTRSMTVEQKLSLQPQQNIGECENVTAAPSLKHEAERIKTFPVDWNCQHSAAEFAAEGFFYNDDDRVQCVFCTTQVQIRTEMEDESVKDMHKRKQNRCPFLCNKFTDNVPINAQADQDDDQSLPADAEDLNVNLQSTPVGAITRYEDRKNTFIGHWSLNHRESATFLAKAGFSLLADQPDEEDPIKIKCYQCEVEIYVDDEKNTIQVHQDANPNCPLIQLRNTFSNELSNIEEPEEPNIVEENLTIQVEGGLQNNDPEVQPAETVPSQEENQSRGSQDRVVNDLNQSDSELENTQNNREPTNQSYQVEYQIPAQVDTENDNIVGPVPSTSSQYYDQTHSIKSDPDKRLGTFQTDECPLILRILRRNLVDSGLYYTGDADIVRCFLCNILLGDWRTNHEPWQRHALSSQNLGGVCRYVRETKPQNHLNRFLRRQRECNTCSHPPKIARIGP